MKVCRDCGHLMPEPVHVCPAPEYLYARSRLVEAACIAQDHFTDEELEEHARKIAEKIPE